MPEPLLAIDRLSVDFHTSRGLVHAVRDVSLSIDVGQAHGLLGESGSGKSVTAAAVMNLIDSPPGFVKSGRILFHGQDLLTASEETRRRINGRQIAMIFQDPLAALNPVYSVGWQIAEACRVHDLEIGDPHRFAAGLLDQVGIANAANRVHDYPHQFSGGERQRVMIAIALATKPELIIADEATSALDVTVQAQILDLLKELHREIGMALLLITHDLSVVVQMASQVSVMRDGQIVETGAVDEVLRNPKHSYTRQLLDAVPGRLGFPDANPALTKSEPLLSPSDITKIYGRPTFRSRRGGEATPAVNGVSFDLHKGETLGIVGESGSGKSTVARILLALDAPSSGSVRYRGRDMATFAPSEMFEFRRHVQVVFQDPTASLNPFMTVEQLISEPWAIHRDALPRSRWSEEVAKLLIRVGLKAEHAHRYPHQFSGGQRQRIAIARALALEPEIIVCDEAVSALDVSIRAQIMELLKTLRAEGGISFIFIAHDLSVVRDFADRVIVMWKGKIVEAGVTAELFENPTHPYTQALLSATGLDEVLQLVRREDGNAEHSAQGIH